MGIEIDLEDGDIIDFSWFEDREVPPIVKGRVKKKEKEKDDSKDQKMS